MTQAAILAASGSPGTTQGFKNRIINGNMVVNQRAASGVPANAAYTLDRWQAQQSGGGVYTVTQSSTAPAGFINSLLVTVTTPDTSLGTSDYYIVNQNIEGLNVTDLGWGTANAKTVTLSFWVRSSLTGTFGGSLMNDGYNRAYPFSYTITTANTWTQISITIAGDTTGTWLTTNGTGIRVEFGLGLGTNYVGTAGAWVASEKYTVTGAVSVIGTTSATWYITGIQLEVGTTATNFDFRSYGTELSLCQRYFQTYGNVYQGSSFSSLSVAPMGWAQSGTDSKNLLTFVVPMRSAPTAAYSNIEVWDTIDGSAYAVTGIAASYTTLYQSLLSLSVASGLTTRRPYWAKSQGNGNAGYITLSAEL
jgi:hypothetical protein